MKNKTPARIRRKVRLIGEMLAYKNLAYGDSALRPVGIFSAGDAEASIAARIDDKLARVRNAPGAFGENEVVDLIGYLVLLLLAREDKQRRGKS
jgi:hypothetical protein